MTTCGFVALIGAPNAGKSTLLNKLVGAKVSIVSRKAQTTRGPVRGVAIEGEAQIVFVDTPGLFAPKRRLDRAMSEAAWTAATDADVLALIVDARAEAGSEEIGEDVQRILDGLAQRKKRKVLILNKIDLVERSSLLALVGAAQRGAGLRRDLHDLGRNGERARPAEARPRPADAAGAVALPGRPDRRRADARARRRDHAREDFRAAARRVALSDHRRDRVPGKIYRTARRGWSRRSM